MNNFFMKNTLVASVLTLSLLVGCGDDSSSDANSQTANDPGILSSDSGAQNPTGEPGKPSENEGPEVQSSAGAYAPETFENCSTVVPEGLPTEAEIAKDLGYVSAAPIEQFVSMKSVYEGLKPGERVIFIVRHARRSNDTSKEGALLLAGERDAEYVGGKLASAEPFFYAYSEFNRTHATASHIALGRGVPFADSLMIPQLNGEWYIQDQEKADAYIDEFGNYNVVSDWAYNGNYADAFYDINSRSVELITRYIIPAVPCQYRTAIMVSHDYLLVGLTVYATNKAVDLRHYENKRWLWYISGLAIVIDANNDRRYIPVYGVDRAVFDDVLEPGVVIDYQP